MDIDKKIRKKIIDDLGEKININKRTIIENSIFEFSKNYAENNDIPFLLDKIYEDKSTQLISQIFNEDSNFLLDAIINDTIDIEKIAFMIPEHLDPKKYGNIIKKREIEELKKNNKLGTSAFTCNKCKKSNCSVTQKQTRAGDEPPTTFVKCLECGNTFKFN